MKTINYLFSSQNRFESFVKKSGLDSSKQHFVQVFMGDNDSSELLRVQQIILQSLPLASLISTSTSGEIIEGGMQDDTTVISISTFDATDVKTVLIEGDSEDEIAIEVLSMISSTTKLVLVFNNVFSNDGELLLNALETKLPDIKIAGGNAGDNGEHEYVTVVGANEKVSTSAIAVAIFDSDSLQVYNDYLFNWQTIGEPMQVTKSDKSTIYEINNQKAQDIYRTFLGNEVANTLPSSAIEFPLIFNTDGIDIARAPIALGENGELIMAGHIKQGDTVKFGFGDVAKNDINVAKTIKSFSQNPIESIFIYSCSARKYFFQDQLNSEFEMLQRIAPTSGFVTYGEFYRHNQCNKMLNVSSTFIGLSENNNVTHDIDFITNDISSSARTLHALTHLVKETSKHVEEKNKSLNQFQHLIKEATLYSTTDKKGIITDANDLFIKLSGYSKDELIGKNHNIVRHEDMPKEVYEDMWRTIQNKQNWKGIIKNRAKDGSEYYVRSNIFPLVDTNDEIVEYVSLRDDITEEMQRKNYLEGSLDVLQEKTNEKEYLLGQYEKVINLNNSFFRIDPKFNLTYVNDVFCNIYKSTPQDLKNKNLVDIVESDFFTKNNEYISNDLLNKGNWTGVVPFQRKDKSIIYMDTSVNTIYDKDNQLIELMLVMNDITDLMMATEEIEATQKDIVFTMGAIGETRSKETGNHVKRVAEYSKLFALYSGLSSDKAELLKMASPMHDIGKVGIPDSILNKPGKLTNEEWVIMQTHSALGYEMLKHSTRTILKTAAIVAYTHHEKWDGSGYPDGIKGNDIHIYGRITAIADVFDALGSDRCYKKAWPDDEIFALIKEGRGTHFDPNLVDIFFKELESFLKIRDTFKD